MHLDHIIIHVDSLEKAIEDFTHVGFNVCPGRAGKKQYNAMIYFKEGPYLELLAPSTFPWFLHGLHVTHLSSFLGYFGARVAHFIGMKKRVMDWAIGVEDIHAYRKTLASHGAFSKVIFMSKVNCLGEKVSWNLFAPQCFELPFFISSYTPHIVPAPSFCEHENGIISLKKMCYLWREAHIRDMSILLNQTLIFEKGAYKAKLGAYEIVFSREHEGVYFDAQYATLLAPLKSYTVFTE